MNNNRSKSKGSVSLPTIAGVVAIVLAGSYYYFDYQADSRAKMAMTSLVNEAQAQGVSLSYSDVDASPLNQSVEITDFAIQGNAQEPDIKLGSVVMKGFSWQDINNNQNMLPLIMSIDIKNGELYIKKNMSDVNPDLQSLVRIVGNRIPFSTQISYQFEPTKNQLELSLTQTVKDNFLFDSKVTLGKMNWISLIDQRQPQLPPEVMSEAMKSTLNTIAITYKNKGLIEKIRADISHQTGKTTEQLIEESIAQIKQLKKISAQQWGPIFTPFIDEIIQFSTHPKQLKLSINPIQPLSGQNIMMAFMGGETSLINLIEDANIKLKAN